MAKANNKTQPTAMDPDAFLATVEPERRRQDGRALLALFDRITGLKAQMWGASIIGYGRYHYTYDSGREGSHLITGFSPRKAALSIYIMPGYRDMSEKLERLGKHKIGKSCLYINKLADVDMEVLENLIRNDWEAMARKYPE